MSVEPACVLPEMVWFTLLIPILLLGRAGLEWHCLWAADSNNSNKQSSVSSERPGSQPALHPLHASCPWQVFQHHPVEMLLERRTRHTSQCKENALLSPKPPSRDLNANACHDYQQHQCWIMKNVILFRSQRFHQIQSLRCQFYQITAVQYQHPVTWLHKHHILSSYFPFMND